MTRKEIGKIAGLLLGGAIIGTVVTAHFTVQSDEVPCVAGQDEKCMPRAFMKAYAKQQDDNAALQKESNILKAAIPDDCDFDGVAKCKVKPKPPEQKLNPVLPSDGHAPNAPAAQPATPPKK